MARHSFCLYCPKIRWPHVHVSLIKWEIKDSVTHQINFHRKQRRKLHMVIIIINVSIEGAVIYYIHVYIPMAGML